MLNFIVKNLLWSQGINILLVVAFLVLAGLFVWRPILYFGLFLFLFSLYFFRNPERTCVQALQDDLVLACPADGKIIDIRQSDSNEFDGYGQRVSIFLSVFNVHVNRAPMSGTIEKIEYRPGEFALAYLPKSSELNERNDVCIYGNNGKTILVRQIAGTIARTICCWKFVGDKVSVGQRYGMIKFGSRVDILLPKDFLISVKKDQNVYGGQTVLGKFKDA